MIPIAHNMMEKIRDHAVSEYPFECCGLIIGKVDSDAEDILRRCKNIQNTLHAKDPETFTRDARTAYYIDPKELMDIFRETEGRVLVVKWFYHSHPDHGAYFSEEDRRMALFDEEPLYPQANYLVVSVYDRKVKDEAFFSWDPETRTFPRKN
tara:strand:- start:400 stop:855 length:456 start_codon:yes stop_codon:yes gene_type:complete